METRFPLFLALILCPLVAAQAGPRVFGAKKPAASSALERLRARHSETSPETPVARSTTLVPQGKRKRVYYVGPRDVLSVTLFTQDKTTVGEDSSLEIPVSAGGEVILPLIGRVKAANKTTIQLEGEMTTKYRHFLNNPQVSVVVKEHRAKVVWVVGQVENNGPIYLEHDQTSLFEVLSRAGGLVRSAQEEGLDGADGRNIVVQRGPEKFIVDFFGEALDRQGSREFLVQPEDRIFVPEPADRVQVLGGVRDAKEVRLRPGMTLLQAIAKAGSFTKGSRRDQIRIIRDGGGQDNTLQVDGTRIFHGKEEDVLLLPGDVVYVSEW